MQELFDVNTVTLNNRMDLRAIARLVMYSMGRHREIERMDRDQYVKILWDNIRPRKYSDVVMFTCIIMTVHAHVVNERPQPNFSLY